MVHAVSPQLRQCLKSPMLTILAGKGFAHPQDVRSHHHNGADTKKNCPLGAGHEWDEHPSCKVGQSDLNYATVKDGFVFMDQESWDKLHDALAKLSRVASKVPCGLWQERWTTMTTTKATLTPNMRRTMSMRISRLRNMLPYHTRQPRSQPVLLPYRLPYRLPHPLPYRLQ